MSPYRTYESKARYHREVRCHVNSASSRWWRVARFFNTDSKRGLTGIYESTRVPGNPRAQFRGNPWCSAGILAAHVLEATSEVKSGTSGAYNRAGFTLVEVVVSVLLISLGLAGILSVSIQSAYRSDWSAQSLSAQ